MNKIKIKAILSGVLALLIALTLSVANSSMERGFQTEYLDRMNNVNRYLSLYLSEEYKMAPQEVKISLIDQAHDEITAANKYLNGYIDYGDNNTVIKKWVEDSKNAEKKLWSIYIGMNSSDDDRSDDIHDIKHQIIVYYNVYYPPYAYLFYKNCQGQLLFLAVFCVIFSCYSFSNLHKLMRSSREKKTKI